MFYTLATYSTVGPIRRESSPASNYERVSPPSRRRSRNFVKKGVHWTSVGREPQTFTRSNVRRLPCEIEYTGAPAGSNVRDFRNEKLSNTQTGEKTTERLVTHAGPVNCTEYFSTRRRCNVRGN